MLSYARKVWAVDPNINEPTEHAQTLIFFEAASARWSCACRIRQIYFWQRVLRGHKWVLHLYMRVCTLHGFVLMLGSLIMHHRNIVEGVTNHFQNCADDPTGQLTGQAQLQNAVCAWLIY